MKKIGNNQTETWFIGLVPVFIGLLMLVSSMPLESLAVPPGNVDSGNYVADNHNTHIAYYNFNDIYSYYDEELDEDIDYVWDDSGRDKKGILKGNDIDGTDERDNNINGNGALAFNGNDDYVHVNHSTDFDIGSNNFAISALIKASSDGSDFPICSKLDPDDNGFTFYLDDQGLLGFTVWESGSSSSIVDTNGDDLRDDNWHFVAVEVFQDTARLYIDPSAGSYGEVEVANNFNDDPGDNDVPFYIGREDDEYYKGDIDFIYFYKLETSVLPAPTSRDRMWGLENVGYWPMDEGLIESMPSDRNYINDMVRSDFHSYGLADPGVTSFSSSGGINGNSAPGTHCLQSYGNGGVTVNDAGNYLGFNCGPYEDDIYIEFWVSIEDIDDNIMLVEKWDWLSVNTANGYRVYIDYDYFSSSECIALFHTGFIM